MNNQSPRWHLDDQDKQKIYTIFIHGAAGILVTLISEVFLKINYGIWTPFITMGLSLASLTLTQYADGPSQSSLRIAELEAQLQAQSALQNQPQESVQQTQIAPTSQPS